MAYCREEKLSSSSPPVGPWYSGEELSLAKPLLRSLGCSSLLSHRAAPPAMDTYPDATPFRGNCGAPACRAIEQPCLQCTTTRGLAAGPGKLSLCGRKGFGGTGLEKTSWVTWCGALPEAPPEGLMEEQINANPNGLRATQGTPL